MIARDLIIGAAALALATIASPAVRGGASLAAERVHVPASTLVTILPPAPDQTSVTVAAFDVDRIPVTNAQFASFVAKHPRWRRDRVARVFADDGYLAHWPSPVEAGSRHASQPVTRVSWFAASAYCEAIGARLPTWHEWERLGAASESAADARGDDAWRQRILAWYSRPATEDLPRAGLTSPNYFGVRDVHGVVWEWVLDLGALMPSADSREDGDPDLTRFCGAGATSLEQKENYATFMRVAMLSSMKAEYTSRTMGFRCVTDSGVSP